MALANRPNLLLLDEPFGALDAITRRKLQKFYESKVKGRVSAIFVTHDVDEALLIGDHVRIGVQKQGVTIQTKKENSQAHIWELTDSFISQKAKIIKALETMIK